jgi:ribosome biogenesis protein Nip4
MARSNSRILRRQAKKEETKLKTPIADFVKRFGARINLDERLTISRKSRHYLINPSLSQLLRRDFYHAGIYLGKTRDTRFFPGFGLLGMIPKTDANRIVVDAKSAWLFVCGRDIFKTGILQASGTRKKGAHVLVLNENGECLGFGKILQNLDQAKTRVAVKNILDIGDFLRRERHTKPDTQQK